MNPVDAVRGATIGALGLGMSAGRVSGGLLRALGGLPLPTDAENVEAWRRAVGRVLRELIDVPEVVIDAGQAVTSRPAGRGAGGADEVREAFQLLLRRSTDVDDDAGEPALLDIVSALSPDEARIIRQLAQTGPAATLDLFRQSVTGTTIVLPRVCLVAQQAGCMHDDRVEVYLANLERLGLVRFSSQPVEDASEYQLLEGMPAYKEAAGELREETGARAKGRRGQVALTPLGQALARIGLADDSD